MPYNDRVYRCFHCHHYQQQYPLPLQLEVVRCAIVQHLDDKMLPSL